MSEQHKSIQNCNTQRNSFLPSNHSTETEAETQCPAPTAAPVCERKEVLAMSHVSTTTTLSMIKAFMFLPINLDTDYSESPAEMLRNPVEGIDLGHVAANWVEEIIASDDPDFEFGNLIDHVCGLLHNLEMVRAEYAKFIGKAA